MRIIAGATRIRIKKKQRGITIVELLIMLGILAVITPALSLAIVQLLATPQDTSAALISSHDANYAAEVISLDASCADNWIPEPDPVTNPNNYGTFTWTEVDDTTHVVLYYYDPDNDTLMRQETIGGTAGDGIVIAQGVANMADVSFNPGTYVSLDPLVPEDLDALCVTVHIKVSQNDATGDAVDGERTFRAWMRTASPEDVWGLRRSITINNGNATRLTDYPMLLDLTGGNLDWDMQSEIDAGQMDADGADIRFVHHARVWELPITITGGTPEADYQVRVEITDQEIVNHMAPNYDGSDVRFFSAEAAAADIYDPAASNKLSFWIQERTDTNMVAWVKVLVSGTTQIFMYYGDPTQDSESSAADTFTASQFTDTFSNQTLIDAGESGNTTVSGGEVQINLTTGILGDPSFELDDGSWTGYHNHTGWPGAWYNKLHWSVHNNDAGGPTVGQWCAKLWADQVLLFIPPNANHYTEVRQANVDLTWVSSISFDTRLWATAGGYYEAQVLVDGNIEWRQALPTTTTLFEDEIDVTGYTGNHTIRLRVQCLKNTSNQRFTAYWDEIRTAQYAKVTSVGIPQDAGSRFALGDEFSWNDDTSTGVTDVVYYVEEYSGGAWTTIPSSVLPGGDDERFKALQDNENGFTTSPVDDWSLITPDDYEQVRLKAYLCTTDDTQSPALEDWILDYYSRNYSSDPATTYDTNDEVEKSTARFELLSFYLDSTDQTDDADGIWDPGNDNVKLWVNISYLPPGDSEIFVYYGNTKAGTLPPASTETKSYVTDKRFFDTFADWSQIDTDDSQHVTVTGGQVEVVQATAVVSNPSFESSDDWMFFNDDDDLAGTCPSPDWASLGSNSVHLYTSQSGEDGMDDTFILFVWRGHYTEAVQDVDLTDVHTLNFDWRLRQDTEVWPHSHNYQAQVWADDQMIWSHDLPRSTDTDSESIDISGYGFEGTYTLSYRVTLTSAVTWLLIIPLPGTYREFDAYFDNITTDPYTDDIYLYSEAIPTEGTFTNGVELSWNDTEGDGDIKYHVEYSNDSGTSWTLIPDIQLPSNSAGFDDSPVDLTGVNWTLYDQIRLRADITTAGGTLPTIQDWMVIYERVATSEPETQIPIGAEENVSHELPMTTYDEAVGTGDGSETQFDLDNAPVIEGFETIYLDGFVTTDYTLDYETGEITFTTAPENGVAITADYQYEQ